MTRLLDLVRRAPWGGLIGYGALILMPLLLFWRALFAGESLFWGTPLLQFIPWQQLAADMWRSGHLPLWNPLAGCGAPLAANYQTGAFYPLYGLALAMPAETALGWSVALHLAMAGFAMAAWARSAGLERFPALLAALALQGSGFLVARAGLFPSIAVAFAWIPMWLWRAERLMQSRRLADTLWLGGAVGLGLLAGHAQTAFYGLLLLSAYSLFRMIQQTRSPATRPSARRSLFIVHCSLFILSLLIGFGLAAIQLLPTTELLALSQRSAGVEREIGLTYSFWPWRFLTLLAPDMFGNPAHGTYWGYGNYWEDAAYVGLLPLALALAAVIGLRKRPSQRGATIFWASVIIISLFLALGRHNPVFMWLFDHIPFFDAFQSPSRWLALTTVGLAALAGIGAQNWRRGRASQRWSASGLVAGLAIALGGLGATAFVPGIPATFGPATIHLGLTLAACGGVALPRRDTPHWRAAVAGLVLLDLLVAGWGLIPTLDRALYAGQSRTAAALASEPAFERVFWPYQGQHEPGYELKFERYFRFDTFGPRALAFWWPIREALLPNLAMLDGLPSANNFDPLVPEWALEAAQASDEAPALLRAMGVTHLVTATVAGEAHITPVPDSLGRAWVVPAARVLPADQVLAALTDPLFDPSAQVLLIDPAPVEAQASDSPNPQSLTLRDTPNRVTIRAALDRPGYLVLADTWVPGWQATVNGEAVPLLRANYAFRAIYLEAGEHAVEMVYRPLSVTIGGILSLATLGGLAIGLVLLRRERQQSWSNGS